MTDPTTAFIVLGLVIASIAGLCAIAGLYHGWWRK